MSTYTPRLFPWVRELMPQYLSALHARRRIHQIALDRWCGVRPSMFRALARRQFQCGHFCCWGTAII